MTRHLKYFFVLCALIAIEIVQSEKVFAAPPTVPDIGGTIWIFPGGTTANIVRSVDPEGQNIMYDIDWDGNGTVDGTTGYFASGAIVNIGVVAPVLAPQVKARARDTAGEVSAWSAPYLIETTTSCEWGQGDNPKGRVFGTPIVGQRVDFMVANCYHPSSGYGYPVYTDGTWASGGPGPFSQSTSGLYKIDSWMMSATYSPGSHYVAMEEHDQYGNDTGMGQLQFLNFSMTSPVSGTCGSSNGASVSSAPTTNLCSSGTNSPVTGSGPWNWGCYGNYPQAVSCNANIITSYNCEAGSFNPALSILTNNSSSVLGFALNTATRVYHSVFGGACFYNTSGANLFIPTKTAGELNSFINHLPAGVTKANGGW